MNQSVAPTSFITSTSRRRAKSESRIVFAISRIEAITSSAASAPTVSFTKRVAARIFFACFLLSRTSSIAGSIGRVPPSAAFRRSAVVGVVAA